MEFGDIIWIAVLVIATFGGSLGKLFKKKSEAFDESPQPVSYPEWETEAADVEVEAAESSETQENPYFTYEDPKVKVHTSAPVMMPATEVNHRAAMLGDEPFDLRKAVIYQTIMQNDYIYEK